MVMRDGVGLRRFGVLGFGGDEVEVAVLDVGVKAVNVRRWHRELEATAWVRGRSARRADMVMMMLIQMVTREISSM